MSLGGGGGLIYRGSSRPRLGGTGGLGDLGFTVILQGFSAPKNGYLVPFLEREEVSGFTGIGHKAGVLGGALSEGFQYSLLLATLLSLFFFFFFHRASGTCETPWPLKAPPHYLGRLSISLSLSLPPSLPLSLVFEVLLRVNLREGKVQLRIGC